MWLSFLDKFFFVFHSLIVLFLLFGWTWRRTRLAHLGLVLVTAFFWGVAGIWYGFGYCPCTDWHWTVKEKLGQRDLPNSYIKYLADSITGLDLDARTLDLVTGGVFAAVFLLSAFLNYRGWRRRRRR